jgi:MoxR-like ATPase
VSSTKRECWSDLNLALQYGANRILLYGMPGTGKTYYALNKYLEREGQPDRRAYRVLCAPDMTTADVDGMWRPSRDEWHFGLGSAFRAFAGGHRLILDELDQASGDVLTALLLYCDSDGSAVREHPETAELVRAHQNFEIIATTNAERLSDLPANLLDRFPVRINIDKVNPQALQALKQEFLRDLADNYSQRPLGSRYSIRSFVALDQLIEKGMPYHDAVALLFPDEQQAICEAFTVNAAVNNSIAYADPTPEVVEAHS